ncbi:hypothetical protein [uncultured Microscilla sp.]|uniref:hypothetical protein n=1 Tax=uncultured Microscilla sp. TaxID=432653 RepID=UPI00261910B2|nr:hypothetical protein [uncultured Microscilla sp.]
MKNFQRILLTALLLLLVTSPILAKDIVEALVGGIIKITLAFIAAAIILFGLPIATAIIGIVRNSKGLKIFSQAYAIVAAFFIFFDMVTSSTKNYGTYLVMLGIAILPLLLIQLYKNN